MPSNNYPNIGYTTLGYNKSYFSKFVCTWTTYGGGSTSGVAPDAIITFTSQGLILVNEDSSSIVRFSMNGESDFLELNPAVLHSVILNPIIVSKLYVKLVSGSSASISISSWAAP